MAGITIDGQRALELLHKRVALNPQFVYTRFEQAPYCRYESNGCPSCLVGGALFDAGVPIEQLRAMDTDEGSDSGLGIDEVTLPEGLTITAKAMRVFQDAQALQDGGMAWVDVYPVVARAAEDFGPEREA